MYIILGLGVSSKAVINKLKEKNKDFIVVCNSKETKQAITLHENVINYYMLKYLNFSKIDYAIKSPGIPHYNKYIKLLKNNHVKIINEIELTYLLTHKVGLYIGVSGSVGKSSVVSLLYELIKVKHSNVILAGNIGDPLINYLDIINKDTIIILEVSSFQLDDFVDMKFDIGVLLNIYENHLDFYKKKKDYYLSKFKLTNNQNKNNYFVVNLNDNNIKKMLIEHSFKSKLIDYQAGFCHKNNSLFYYCSKLLDLSEYNLKGNHNLENLKAIVSVLMLLKIDIDIDVLKEFKGLHYHLQETKKGNLLIVNDSKSTSSASTKAAIDTYLGKRIILLFGGYNKNLKFDFLSEYNFKYLICFGKLSKEISKYVGYDIKFDNLHDAVNYALKIAQEEDVVLFSPGCASFDEFDNYLKRGEAFDEYVKEYYDE